MSDSSDDRLSKDHQIRLASQSPTPELIAQPETLEVTANADVFDSSKSFSSKLNFGIEPVREDSSDPATARLSDESLTPWKKRRRLAPIKNPKAMILAALFILLAIVVAVIAAVIAAVGEFHG